MSAGTTEAIASVFSHAPAFWRWIRLKDTVTGCWSGTWGEEPRGGEDDVVCVRVADIDRVTLRVRLDRPTLRYVRGAERDGCLLRPGDLLLEKSGGGELQTVGVVVLYDHSTLAVCSNFLARLTVAPGFSPAFLCYLHSALYRYGINTRSIKQTTGIQNLDSDSYLAETVRVPSLQDQEAIAAFLDRRTGLLIPLVQKHEELIERLRERKLGIISRAVNPAGALVTRLKFLRFGALFYGANHEGAPETPGWPRYIRISDIGADGQLREEGPQSLPPDLAKTYLLEDGDILLARSGATVGKALRYRASQGPACFASYLLRLRPDRRRVIPDYLRFYTQSHGFREQVIKETIQATIANVSAERFANFSIALPPLEEQQTILDYLDRECGLLDSLVSTIQSQIAKLQEYRDALIAGAVTGRMSVDTGAVDSSAGRGV